MLCNKQTKLNLAILLMAAAVTAGAVVATAEVSYHLVLMPDGAGQVTNTGLVLSGMKLLEPASDAAGNPVWDSDGDGIADGYVTTSLTLGGYSEASATSVNEQLGVAAGYALVSGYNQPVLWTNIWSVNGDGTVGTMVDLGGSHGAQEGIAYDLNSSGQVVIREGGREHSWSPWGMGLALVNPQDTDGDGVPDVWFEDADGDGNNDLMIDLEGTSAGGSIYESLRINELGQIVGVSNFGGGFVILPEGNMWFKDNNGDGRNDLQISLGSDSMAKDISNGGRIVGRLGGSHLVQWQIDLQGQVNLIVDESPREGGSFVAVNESSQVVGILYDARKTYDQGILWENGQMIKLLELLDNPGIADILVPGCINDSGTITGTNCWYDKSVKITRCYDDDAFIAVPIVQSPPTPGITVEPAEGLVTTEAGSADTFSIALDTQPTAPVTVGLSSDDTSEGTISLVSVTFDVDNWDVPQIITVTGMDDTEVDGDITYIVITAPAVSDDPDYAGLDADDVTVTNYDDEVPPGLSVDSITPNTMPAGTSIDVTITGSGFQAGATVNFENGRGSVPAVNITSVDGTTIEATVTTHRKAKRGVSWDVRVTNPDGSSDVLVDGFTLT
jgi:hypothetical protein